MSLKSNLDDWYFQPQKSTEPSRALAEEANARIAKAIPPGTLTPTSYPVLTKPKQIVNSDRW